MNATRNSEALHGRASEFAPSGVQGAARFYRPYPLFIARAAGSRMWDVDGNEYLDYAGAYGPAVLGHNEPRIVEDVVRALKDEGTLFVQPHPREVELAETISEVIPYGETTTFHGGGGSDAIYNAVRLARAHTGRRKLLKFEGGYHGWHDDVAISIRPAEGDAGPYRRPTAIAGSAGALPCHVANAVVAPFNDFDATEALVAEYADELAAIIVEPVVHSSGCLIPKPGFLQLLRDLCDRHGIVLIFDEIMTGFRHALEGAGAQQGVFADLGCFGKAMAGGFVIAALTGRAEIMSLMAPQGPVLFSGTFNSHLLSVVAAQTTIDILRTEPVHARLDHLGALFSSAVNASFARHGVTGVCNQYGSVWNIYFGCDAVDNYRDVIHSLGIGGGPRDNDFRMHLRDQGIYVQPHSMLRGFISYAHEESDIKRTTDVIDEFIATVGS